MHKEITPNKFFTTCTGKRIYVTLHATLETRTQPVMVTKSALKKVFKNSPVGTVIRYTENETSFVILLIH